MMVNQKKKSACSYRYYSHVLTLSSLDLSFPTHTHMLEMDGESERGNEREKEQTVEPGKAGYKTNPDSCLQRQSGVHMAHLHRVRRQERIVSCPKTGRENLDTRLTQIKLDWINPPSKRHKFGFCVVTTLPQPHHSSASPSPFPLFFHILTIKSMEDFVFP